MKAVSIGVLGCGRIARGVHLPALGGLAGARVALLAEADAACLRSAAASTPDARLTNDYAGAIDDPEVEAIVVCLPPHLHADAARRCLRAGKHVYVEKPLAVGLDEATALVRARREAGVVGAVGFNYRADPAYAAMREVACSADAPRLIHARSTFTSAPASLPSWKKERSTGGGVLLDLGSHHFDLYAYALGRRVVEVDARTRSRSSDGDTASVHAVLDDGSTVESYFTFGAVDEDCFELYYDGVKHRFDRYTKTHEQPGPAAFRYGRGAALADATTRVASTLARLVRAPGEPSFAASLGAFVRAVQAGGPPLADFDDGLHSLRVVDAAERAAAEHRSVLVEHEPV